jgi:hypothetical protein
VLTCKFFAPVRTTEMGTETTGAENALPEQEAPKNSGRPPPVVMASTKNFIRLQSDLKKTPEEGKSSEAHEMEPVS